MNSKTKTHSPISTIDVVLFTIIDEALNVLLLNRPNAEKDPYPNSLSLPGGFVRVDEDFSLDDTARRVLSKKVGIREHIYLEQLQTFSGLDRDPRGWSISHSYCALAPKSVADNTAPSTKWVNADMAVEMGLAFDHAEILKKALERVRNKTNYSLLPANFLPRLFTLGEIQKIYEIVLGISLDKSSFRKKIDSLDAFSVEEGEMRSGRQRPAQLYSLKSTEKLPTFRSNFHY